MSTPGADFDELTGGNGADTFSIGSFFGEVYNRRGHATITDFLRSQKDQIEIFGEFDEYRVVTRKNVGGAVSKDSAIYDGKDLIAIVYDVTDLKRKDFISVGFTFEGLSVQA